MRVLAQPVGVRRYVRRTVACIVGNRCAATSAGVDIRIEVVVRLLIVLVNVEARPGLLDNHFEATPHTKEARFVHYLPSKRMPAISTIPIAMTTAISMS